MAPDISFEQYCAYITSLNKEELKDRLLHFDGPLRMDFTEDFLEQQNIEKLQHILLAAMVTAKRKKVSL